MPQAATLLPNVSESVMVPVDVVKHGSQPGKHLAVTKGWLSLRKEETRIYTSRSYVVRGLLHLYDVGV